MTLTFPSTTIRVFIVDDHELVRRGLTTVINAEPDMTACGCAEDAHSALSMIRRQEPDVAIIDISLKENGSIDLIRKIRAVDQRVQIICLSMRDHPVNASKVIEAGAHEYLVKQGVAGRVTDAIRRIQLKRKNLPVVTLHRDRAAGQSANPFSADSDDHGLTPAELEIVELIGRGLPSQGIAALLHLSVGMVEMYRRNIMACLGFRDPARLIQYCVDSSVVRGPRRAGAHGHTRKSATVNGRAIPDEKPYAVPVKFVETTPV
jgi:DNA-binding NarL/FixJ family response regulator